MMLVAAGALAGCASTQTQAARVRLNNDRKLASQTRTRVTGDVSKAVKPVSVHLVRDRKHVAFVVDVRNSSGQTASDLPISVGYRAAGKRVYANGSSGLLYYNSHLPAVRPNQTLTWVFATTGKIPHGSKLFAVVGAKQSLAAPVSEDDVPVAVANTRVSRDTVSLKLTNGSSIPQYQLQVYVYARKHGKYLAAADATIKQLWSNSSQVRKLHLVGDADGLHIQTTAIPTILK